MANLISEELAQAKYLMEEGKLDEALYIVNKFEEKKALTPQERLSCHLVKSSILGRLMRYRDCLKYAKMAYRESQGLEKSLLFRTSNLRNQTICSAFPNQYLTPSIP